MVKQQSFSFLAPPPALHSRAGVEHHVLACRSILNYCDTPRMPQTFTLNPYRGCEFGCRYCYARYTHQFMDLEGEEFERRIYVKKDAGRALMRTLDRERIAGRHIAIGTVTDPYQPAEARYGVTRSLLEVFTRMEGLDLSLTSRSSLMERDIDLFRRVGACNRLRINISLISLEPGLLRELEPKATSPAARLALLSKLRQAGLEAGLFLMPILPGLTDSRSNLESVMAAAREHDACHLRAAVVFLRGASRDIFFEFLRRRDPVLYRRYRQWFGHRSTLGRRRRQEILERVAVLKERYGFSGCSPPPPRQRAGVASPMVLV